jgi:hypothetical protein
VLAPGRTQHVQQFVNITAEMNSSLDEDIASIVSVNNEFLCKHFIKECSTSDDDSDLMLAMTSILHEDNEAQTPQWKGYVPGQAKNLDHNREARHMQL